MITKYIKLCADDFGYNDFVSQGIIQLVAKQRLSATSCMTNMPNWNKYLSELLKFRDHIEIGLHFNLTEGNNLKLQTFKLNSLIVSSYLRKITVEDIEVEFEYQLRNFENSTGFLPEYIDGHQHIQQLPVIRHAIVNVIKRHYTDRLPYIRIASNGLVSACNTSTKALVIHLLGANKLRKLAKENNISTNSSFAGFSKFKNKPKFIFEFERYLLTIRNNGLVMCHPGLDNPNSNDVIAASRAKEYHFLMSDAFITLLQKYQTALSVEKTATGI